MYSVILQQSNYFNVDSDKNIKLYLAFIKFIENELCVICTMTKPNRDRKRKSRLPLMITFQTESNKPVNIKCVGCKHNICLTK